MSDISKKIEAGFMLASYLETLGFRNVYGNLIMDIN